jgi:hypothetical protein
MTSAELELRTEELELRTTELELRTAKLELRTAKLEPRASKLETPSGTGRARAGSSSRLTRRSELGARYSESEIATVLYEAGP